ncbi:hypothetical protein ScPMuIL_001901 [Solemya velum]
MAQGAPGTSVQSKLAAKCNFVAQDSIWKDHVKLEETAAKSWPDQWGFLTTSHEDLVQDEFPNRKNRKKAAENTDVKVRQVTPLEKYVKVGPSPKPFPKTTTQSIGWRSGKPELALEKYGKYAKPKGGLVKQFNWPREAIV